MRKELNPKDVVNNSFIFSGLPPGSVDKLAKIARAKKTPKGQALFHQGDQAHGFYLLAEGQVRLIVQDPNGRERVVKVIRPGEVFGEAAIFQKDGYPCDALADSPLTVLFWPKKEISELLRSDGDLALAMIGILAHKLGHFASLIRLSLKEVLPKVAEYLISWPHVAEKLTDPPKKAVMAKALGVTAESLSRALGRLKRARLIEESPTLAIVDREGLSLIASGLNPFLDDEIPSFDR
jgi:CRP/FNR family transcriptional regulator